MRRTALADAEQSVAHRLRFARDSILGLTFDSCASHLEIHSRTWLNYETGRTPIGAKAALRFCREFVISEEWLATGELRTTREAWGWPQGAIPCELERIGRRLCMDLLSRQVFTIVPIRLPLTDAWRRVLAVEFEDRVKASPYLPSIVFGTTPELRLAKLVTAVQVENLTECIGWLKANHAWDTQRHLLDEIERCGKSLLTKAMAGHPSLHPSIPADEVEEVVTLRSQATREKEGLQYETIVLSLDPVDPESIPNLMRMISSLTSARGSRAALARQLGIAPQHLNAWLSGRRRPNGDMSLRLYRWANDRQNNPGSQSQQNAKSLGGDS